MKRRITILALLLTLTMTAPAHALTVPLEGGQKLYKTVPGWRIQKYVDTELVQNRPFCFAPWESWRLRVKYVSIDWEDNRRRIIIDPEYYQTILPIARENRKQAKDILSQRPDGESKIHYIYRWCRAGTYTAHVKTARDLFTGRTGDCSAHAAGFYVLCQVAHIPVRYYIGWTEYGTLHAYNRVKWRGKWYWVDTTLNRYLSRKLWDDYYKPIEHF